MTIDEKSAVDCIDRQATLNAIIKRLGIKNETYLLEAERAIYQQILAMPPVTPQETRWIPCSERLPEIHQDVILSFRSLEVGVGFRSRSGTCFYCRGDYIELQNVLAWKPLPEPYHINRRRENE